MNAGELALVCNIGNVSVDKQQDQLFWAVCARRGVLVLVRAHPPVLPLAHRQVTEAGQVNYLLETVLLGRLHSSLRRGPGPPGGMTALATNPLIKGL